MKKLLLPILVSAMLLGCSQTDSSNISNNAALDSSVIAPSSLHSLASEINLAIGTAVESRYLDNPAFRETLVREFSQITPENEMKFMYVQPKRGSFDFTKADIVVDFASEHDMIVKGHALIWHIQNPQWLEEEDWTKEELTSVMEQHIKTVVGHYKGKVAYWDVVNEAFDDNGGFRDTLWYRILGEDYIEMAFRFAHEADPDALLFYNDYSTEGMTAKSNAVYRHMQTLIEKGVPIHGVGTQLHLVAEQPVIDGAIARNIERLAALGLDVHFTEIDVRVRDNQGKSALLDQAQRYEMLMKLAAFYPEVDMYTTWGVSDQYSWIPSWFNGYGQALMFDKNYQAKPAYYAVQTVLEDAVKGELNYEPVTEITESKRHIQPFNAKPLSTETFNSDEVVFYPFAYNQLNSHDQRLPNTDVVSGKWAVGYHKNALIGQVSRSDSHTIVDHKQSHENDNIEVFVRVGEQFWQLRAVVGQDFEASDFPGKAIGKWNDEGTLFDFTIEFDDYEDLVGETLGFNIALSDNDQESGHRHAQLYPVTGTNIGWQGEQLGELFMNGQNAVVADIPVSTPPMFKAMRFAQKPSSGNDPLWQQSYRYSLAFNQLNQKDMTVSLEDKISGSWSVGYHEGWLYGIVNRQDPVTVTTKDQSYQNDNVEIFFQQGETMTQLRTVVGQDFEKTAYDHEYHAQWNEDGTQLYFIIELNSEFDNDESILWNIALASNDGNQRKYQLYPVPGSNITYLGEELTKLTLK
ncbi:endo-1,4-beta-xylanase [Vibrio crassostreae]|uniref:endo-1,4-beta-xylanase n=1 Tax=Vibrio crassostreae TaxID=246167 RepID=UPI000F489A6A|nr:endo-1,4-beta-xylanase [Vibrio crassostreae]ROR21115.1 GH35 family endo-1,4-beta-xylanase [Vibrio crassostreae]TCV30853.1 GH35 family endo-1,4-beta-xylanase [Vibrio crassostreae]